MVPGQLRDQPETRRWHEFPRFKRLNEITWGDNPDLQKCLELSMEQVEETPDFGVAYDRLADIQIRIGRECEALTTYRAALEQARCVSGVLDSLGTKFVDAEDGPRCLDCFAAAILAQSPPCSEQNPYLYLAAICDEIEMSNAAESCLQVVDRFENAERLLEELANKVRRPFRGKASTYQPRAIALLSQMLEEERLD
ncbi:MAG: hypothetical protein DHS20C14_22680 [Phycisphaeraceae bacterium]|nr:MAG: hypothetical protein DHS20C14_22680 [Phycisphaeraceae bacterium]